MSSSATLNISIPKTQEKTEITSEPARVSRPVESTEQDLARVAEIYSANIEQLLGVINTLEEVLQAKRSRMEELRTDHEEFALKYKLLGKSLASANRDLAQQLASVNGNLRSDLGLDTVSSSAAEMAKDSPATVNTGEDDRTATGPEIETGPAIEPSEEVSLKTLIELTQMVKEGRVVKLNTDQSHPAENDRAALQKIINRVSLQSGTLDEDLHDRAR